ncbi:MAG: hypothetical protein ACJ786_27140, partial [Catenulispora sp.]
MILLLSAAGCSSGSESATPTAPPPPVNARCKPAGIDIVGQVNAAVTHGISVSIAYYVKSKLDLVILLFWYIV